MSGRFEELVGVSGIDTGEIIYRDDSIDAGTRGLVDMGWVWGGGAKALAIDDRVKNLCWLDDPLIARAALPTAGGGAAFSGDNSYALLPEGFMLRQSDRHMLFTMHLKMNRAAPAGASYNSRIVDFRAGNTSQLSIIPTVDANGAMTNLEIATNSFGWSVMGALSSIVDNKVHQLGVELTVSADEAYIRLSVWLDGVVVQETDYVPRQAWPLPNAGDRPRLGNWAGFAGGFTGRFYRARLDDLTRTSRKVADILADDAAVATARFT